MHDPRNLMLDEMDDFVTSAPRTLVLLEARWSGASMMVSSIVERLASERNDPDLSVGYVNVDQNPGALDWFHVAVAPALLLFTKGELTERIEGLTTRAEVSRALDRQLDPEHDSDAEEVER